MAVRADLNGIKTEIQSILAAANTTTASPIDLSANLLNSKRVVSIMSVNPEMIRPQATLFPFVSCYVKNKTTLTNDIAGSQLNAKRRSVIDVEVVGSLWNDTLVTDTDDPADTDINYLMENIELILRSNPTLNGKVNWQTTKEVTYYTTRLDEQTHLRSGILKLECNIFY